MQHDEESVRKLIAVMKSVDKDGVARNADGTKYEPNTTRPQDVSQINAAFMGLPAELPSTDSSESPLS